MTSSELFDQGTALPASLIRILGVSDLHGVDCILTTESSPAFCDAGYHAWNIGNDVMILYSLCLSPTTIHRPKVNHE